MGVRTHPARPRPHHGTASGARLSVGEALCNDSPMHRRAVRRTGLVAAIVLLLSAVLTGCFTGSATDSSSAGASATAPNSGGASATSAADPVAGSELAPSAATSDLPTVRVSQLPQQAIVTLELIAEGGPFPYDRDGVTFQNREGILPSAPRGFYSEYTVVTPGSKDRGARRIVAGDDGSRYYTDDHYDSFREVVAG